MSEQRKIQATWDGSWDGSVNAPSAEAEAVNSLEGPTAVPDIHTLLAELSQYSSSQQQASHTEQAPKASHQSHQPQQQQTYQDQYPPTSQNTYTTTDRSRDPRLNSQHLNRQTATPPAQPRTPPIDPATILEWPQALRCVTKLSAQNPNFTPVIKGMITDQERNVQQWWTDREELVKKQAGRAESVKQLNETLKAIGGNLATAPTPEEDKAELERFDLKVYNASKQMFNFHASELKRLGVPFFGVNPSLIIANDLQQTAAIRNPLSQATVTEEELVGLQKKMIQYLEDMYGD